MKHVKTYEAYSFPDTLLPIVDKAHRILFDKFKKWFHSKSSENYYEQVNIKMDRDIYSNKDFPLK